MSEVPAKIESALHTSLVVERVMRSARIEKIAVSVSVPAQGGSIFSNRTYDFTSGDSEGLLPEEADLAAVICAREVEFDIYRRMLVSQMAAPTTIREKQDTATARYSVAIASLAARLTQG
jgi:hypothetical protein